MKKVIILFSLGILLCCGCATTHVHDIQPQASSMGAIEPITKDDSILILAPHPDDEAIACAGIIQEAVRAGAAVKIAYLTNGEHNEFASIVYEKRVVIKQGGFIHMGELRRKEAIKAMQFLGLSERDLVFLGYPDFGTFVLFRKYWDTDKPLKDMLTRISKVPYKQNPSFGAPYFAENALADLKRVLLAFRPNKIFVSHPADVNVDHRAYYLFLQVALRELGSQLPSPKVYPYLVHCARWPIPRHYHPELEFTPPKSFDGEDIGWERFDLSPEQIEKKYKAILCYRTQTRVSAFYLLAFARRNELFGDYPAVELVINPEVKKRGIKFFGFSGMFIDPPAADIEPDEDEFEEKARVSYAVGAGNFIIKVEKAKELVHRFKSNIYVFGYSGKTPFAKMPKLHVITKHNTFRVLNQKKLVDLKGMSLELDKDALTVRIPLLALGDPDFIMVSVSSTQGSLPIESTGFRRINVR